MLQISLLPEYCKYDITELPTNETYMIKDINIFCLFVNTGQN